MSNEKMREEFEAKWGYSNEEQGLQFIPGLNVYGCDLYDNADIASSKSSAWYYWQASRAAIEVELPEIESASDDPWLTQDRIRTELESLGVRVKP